MSEDAGLRDTWQPCRTKPGGAYSALQTRHQCRTYPGPPRPKLDLKTSAPVCSVLNFPVKSTSLARQVLYNASHYRGCANVECECMPARNFGRRRGPGLGPAAGAAGGPCHGARAAAPPGDSPYHYFRGVIPGPAGVWNGADGGPACPRDFDSWSDQNSSVTLHSVVSDRRGAEMAGENTAHSD